MKAGKSFFFVAVMVVLIGTGSAWADLTDGLIAHWKLDGDANDSAGSNDGTLVNGPVWTTGQINGALDFDGVDDYVDCGSSFASITGSASKTITAWAKSYVASYGTYGGRVLALYRDGGVSGFAISAEGDPATWKGRYRKTGDLIESIDSGISVNVAQWTHVAFVQKGSDVNLYINGSIGSSISNAVAPSISSPPNASVGAYADFFSGPPTHFFNGSIDDVRIYNRALSTGEIRQLYGIEMTRLEIEGPNEVAEDFQAQYKAIAYFDNNSTADVTDLADWLVEPNDNCSITAGLLTTEIIDLPEDVTISAQYTEGEVTQEAQKDVSIFAICPSGTALQFDGVDDYVEISDSPSLSPQTITISAWIYPEDVSHTFQIIGKWVFQEDTEYIFDNKANNDALRLAADFGGGDFCVTFSNDAVLTAKTWQHVAVTYDGSTSTFYVNGVNTGEDNSCSGDLPDTDNDIYIGYSYSYTTSGTGGHRPFDGSIDEVAIYNRALSAEEIRVLMHTRPDTDDPNLVGYWAFDEGEGQVAYDLSPYGNDGQLGSTAEVDDNDPNWVDSDAPVGICTLDGLVERNISNVLDLKLEILDLLNIALGKEYALLDYMDEAFHNGEFDNLNKGDVVKAKQKIFSAIRNEEQAETAVGQSIEKLDDSLSVLGY